MIYPMNGAMPNSYNPYAVISVSYPAGSSCTCSNGTRTLKARGTGGAYAFFLPSSGTWIVSCTANGKTASQSLSITARGQSVNVALSYETVVYEKGMTVTSTSSTTPYRFHDLSNGQTIRALASADISIDESGLLLTNGAPAALFKNAYSMDGRSKIYLDIPQNAEAYGGTKNFVLYATRTQYGDFDTAIASKAVQNGSTGKHFELDISAITGNAYIGIYLHGNHSTSPETIIEKLAIV